MQAQTAVSLHYEAIRDKFRPSEWRVEVINSRTGDVLVAIFSGPLARERANEYADFKNRAQVQLLTTASATSMHV
jgi:hypothetical protein